MKSRISKYLIMFLFLGLWFGSSALAETITYGYDDAGRLIRATYGNETEITYTYDAAGNLLSRVTVTTGSCTHHSADYNPADWKINLSELLRGIQFYNIGEYHCDSQGEDGYGTGAGDQTCAPHNSDYNSQDWKINLSELLRLIQFYNIGEYHCDPEGEDGYAPGADL